MEHEDIKLYQPVPDDMDAEENGPQVQAVSEEPIISTGNRGCTANSMETEYSGHYEWEIRNFLKLTDKQTSETFEIGTYLWKLLCFPKQNTSPWRHVSLFLEYPEAHYTPANLSPKAAFKLIIKNHNDPMKGFSKDSSHTFTQDQVDWGFSQMLPLTDVSVPSGYLREDGTMVIRVEITIQRDERYLYDSRVETGFVGLKNQGATCYMNSLLQYLFNLPSFRKAVYHMPVPENEEPSKSLPVALQSLFYRLQYARGPVSTKELTKSFGWNTYDAFMQHDVQELNRVLCEKLEEKMKNTRVEKTINELFEGHTYNFIECIDVSYKSTRKESFMDLQLDVKGCRNIYDSFDKYTEVEVLNGANQYQTDDFGMQDARKGIIFEDLPPVLQLQLKRFEYDCQRDAMVKINDRYEFYDELDLDRDDGKYLSPNADRSVCNKYKLHSVLVHSGGVHGGHYYAFIRSDGKQWLRFDDDRVSREDQRNALDAQFGGGDEEMPGPAPYQQQPMQLKYAKFSNAYMLVYVRVSDWPTIMCDVTKNDISKHLLDRLERETSDKEARHRDKMEAHLYCSLKVATDADIKDQVGEASSFDLVDLDRLPPERCHYRMRKQTKFAEFKEEVARRTSIPVERQRFWTWKRRTNGTSRPERPLTAAEEASQLVDLKDIRDLPREGHGAAGAKKSLMDIRLYLEELPKDMDVMFDSRADGNLLLFFKYYDPINETIEYRGHRVLLSANVVQDVASFFIAEEGLPEDTPALMFEEIKFEPTVMVEPLKPKSTLSMHELNHGDVLVYQPQLSEEEIAAKSVRYPTADTYLAYTHNRRQVHFKRLEDPQAPPSCTLELLRNTTYDEVCIALANALRVDDSTKLRLTRHNYYSNQPQRAPVKYRAVGTLEQLLTHQHHPTDIVYFELLDLPLHEMEQLKTVKVSFHNERGEFVGEQYSLRLQKEATVADLLMELAARVPQAAMEAPGNRLTSQSVSAAPPVASPQAAPTPAHRLSQGGNAATPATVTMASQMADELKAAAALATAGRPMRLLEVQNSKIFKVVNPAEKIDNLDDNYWQLRAEFVPENQLPSSLGPGDFLVHCSHALLPPLPPPAAAYWAARSQGQQQAAGDAVTGEAAGAQGRATSEADMPMDGDDGDLENEASGLHAPGYRDFHQALIGQMPGAAFGHPFLIRVRQHETMGQLKANIQALLGTSAQEFSRWPVLFVGTRPNNAWLDDSTDLTQYFSGHKAQFDTVVASAAAAGAPTEAVLVAPSKLMVIILHEDRGGASGRRQPPSSSRYGYEKPVKIYA